MAKRFTIQKRNAQKRYKDRLLGINPRFAINDRVARVAVKLPQPKQAAPAYDPKTVTLCEPGRYVAPEGKRHARVAQGCYGDGTRRSGLDYWSLWATDDRLLVRV